MNWLKPYKDFHCAVQEPAIEVVSVDIFDTLLLRSTMPEFTKFKKFSQEIAKETPFSLQGLKNKSAYFMRLRVLAAKMVYHQKPPVRGGREAKLSEIYDLMLLAMKLQFDLDDRQVKLMRVLLYKVEISCELSDLSVNFILIEILKQARRNGKKIIAISDMYLSKQDIDELFKSYGIRSLFDQVFVSSEFGYGKASGALFDKVLSLLDVSPNQICHLGDNHISDFLQPVSKGMRAFYSPRSLNWRKTAMLRKWINYKFFYRQWFYE